MTIPAAITMAKNNIATTKTSDIIDIIEKAQGVCAKSPLS